MEEIQNRLQFMFLTDREARTQTGSAFRTDQENHLRIQVERLLAIDRNTSLNNFVRNLPIVLHESLGHCIKLSPVDVARHGPNCPHIEANTQNFQGNCVMPPSWALYITRDHSMLSVHG